MRKPFLCLILSAAFALPFALHASAVKQCKVTAVVKQVKGTPEKPILSIEIKDALFETGHSMGNDCSELTMFHQREIQLYSPVKTAVGRTILLLFTDVRGVTPSGPVRSETWEVHKDYKP